MKLFGHPIHQMLIVFPLGLHATAVAFDIVGLFSINPTWYFVSYWMIASGIIGGLLAAMFGVVDWWGIPANTRAKSLGLLHGGGNVIVVLLFIASRFLRPTPTSVPSSRACSFVAIALALVTGWEGNWWIAWESAWTKARI